MHMHASPHAPALRTRAAHPLRAYGAGATACSTENGTAAGAAAPPRRLYVDAMNFAEDFMPSKNHYESIRLMQVLGRGL